ncbi:hypothetical protein F3N42_10585 [Marinihelvus fidelis]|uniref:Uncharacterized protein n=1 Tax=Marinihelvus fidelis TaxID=2613842 RepID=A0A5N0T776_9GAMM|nr:hypothetical protein [Marinihelvus fidelis]KAA9130810.1 hypothetical protein F3N42_10585 [Marinihelvus fidelis]
MDVANDLKPTLLLALAIFLASAPNPDSDAIKEMTANFIVPKHDSALQASEIKPEVDAPRIAAQSPASTDLEPQPEA